MIREPNLEAFFALVSDDKFSTTDLLEGEGDNLQIVLWYMDTSRVGNVVDEMLRLDERQRDRIIKNLSTIYPLSRDLLREIINVIRGSDYYFTRGFDLEQRFLGVLKIILTDIENSGGGRMTRLFSDYKKDVDRLMQEAERLKATSEQFKELKAQREKLTSEIESLRREANEGQIRKDIEALQDEEARLRSRLRQMRDDHDKRHSTINELKKELQSMEAELDPAEEVGLLRELIRKFPLDTEDER